MQCSITESPSQNNAILDPSKLYSLLEFLLQWTTSDNHSY